MLPFYCLAQKNGRDKLEPGNWAEAADLYQYAIEQEQKDSLLTACYAYIRVYYFDSTADIAKRSEAKLKDLTKKCRDQFTEKLMGSWQWKWSGSNWGTGNEPEMCKCERSIVIDSTNIIFMAGNTIDSSHIYSLKADNYGRWPLFYYIDIPELKQKWNFSFRRSMWSIDTKEPLNISIDVYGSRCICGCPEYIYERIFYK